MENGPSKKVLRICLYRVKEAAYPNSAYNCLIQKSMKSHEAAMTQGTTIKNGLTFLHRVPGPEQFWGTRFGDANTVENRGAYNVIDGPIAIHPGD